jgi:kynurenine formamidase
MARSERSQWARLDFDGVALLADLASGISLGRVIDFEPGGLRCFGAHAASSSPLQVGEFSGSVARGASCNCSVLTLTPHANGTHTESAAHLTAEPLNAYGVVPNRMLLAALVTVEPELAADAHESSLPVPHDADQLITRAAIERGWPAPPAPRLAARAAVIRTLPNAPDKFAGGGLAAPPPFLSSEAAAWLVERGIEHLVLDVPSADRIEDGGKLTAHRLFFGLPPGSSRLAEARRRECTITELAYVADVLRDGWYLLSLQAVAIAGDAVPSRPLLYPLRAA